MRIVFLSWVVLCSGCLSTDEQVAVDERVQVIDGNPLCPACEILFREVALLGDPADLSSVREDAASRGCMVGRLSTGEYLMSGVVGGGEIFVYDGEGPATRSIGRRGRGPGEFGSFVRLAVGQGDTLYIMDDDNARLQVLTPSGEFLRSFQAPQQFRSFALLTDGDFVFFRNAIERGDDLFRLVSPTGDVRARFGRPTLDEVGLETWNVSPAHLGGFWTLSIWSYEFHRWSGPESLDMTFIREADWFPPWDENFPDGVYETIPPPPFLVHVSEDVDARLWAYSQVPDPAWEPMIPRQPSYEWGRRTFDTIVEVIDLKSARVITQGRLDRRLGMVCGSHLMYGIVETEIGDTRVQVVEPTLVDARGDEWLGS